MALVRILQIVRIPDNQAQSAEYAAALQTQHQEDLTAKAIHLKPSLQPRSAAVVEETRRYLQMGTQSQSQLLHQPHVILGMLEKRGPGSLG